MANEISYQAKLQISKSGTTVLGNKSVTRDITGTNFMSSVQTVGTAAETVTVGDLASLRYAYFYNSDSTQTVTLTCSSMILLPGDACVFPPPNVSVTMQATAEGVDVHFVGTET